MKEIHKQLQDGAIRRLYDFGCHIFAKEVPTANGIADALGVNTRTGNVYYIECKASRSDLICEKQRKVYARAIGEENKRGCYYHNYNNGSFRNDPNRPQNECLACQDDEKLRGVTHIDFYYIMVAEGLKVEDTLYPLFGVLDAKGNIVRKAKRMKRPDKNNLATVEAVAHVLVYKVYGKMYLGEQIV